MEDKVGIFRRKSLRSRANRKQYVRTNSPSKSWTWIVRILSLFVGVVSIAAYLFFYTVQRPHIPWGFSFVKGHLVSPTYLSPNEKEEMQWMIYNDHPNEIEALFQLMPGARPIEFLSENGDNCICKGSLTSHQQISPHLPLMAIWDNYSFGKPVPAELSLWGETSDKATGGRQAQEVAKLPIWILSIPYSRTIRWLPVPVVFGLLIWLLILLKRSENNGQGKPGKVLKNIFNKTKGEKKIKVLFLAANPKDTDKLGLDEEIREIDQVLQRSKYRKKFKLKKHFAVRLTDLQEHLLRYKPDIVHFSGHGKESSEIMLVDDHGNSVPVSNLALSQLFLRLKENIRCVVLNACYSEQQARAIAKHIDCVVGMSNKIGDAAAINFAAGFYQALFFGKDVETAFGLGCSQIDLSDLENLGDQHIPKLLAVNVDAKDVVFVLRD